MDDLAKQLDEMRKNFYMVVGQLNDLDKEYALLAGQNNSLRGTVDEYRVLNSQHCATIEGKNIEIKRLTQENEKIEMLRAGLATVYNHCCKDKAALVEHRDQLLAVIADMRKLGYQAPNADLATKLQETEQELADTSEDCMRWMQIVERSQPIVGLLLNALRCAWIMADDAEVRRKVARVDIDDFEKFSDAIEALEELPDDRPGYTMTPVGRAEWALRELLGNPEGGASDAMPVDNVYGYINWQMVEFKNIRIGAKDQDGSGERVTFTSTTMLPTNAAERCAATGGHYWRPSSVAGAYCTQCGYWLPHARFE